jgi:hypothetical protein
MSVPVIQPNILKDAAYSALALLLAGNVAVEKYALFSPRYGSRYEYGRGRSA